MQYAVTRTAAGIPVVFDVNLNLDIELDKSAMRRINSLGEPKTYEQIVRDSCVVALRFIARYTGYQTLDAGQHAIQKDLSKVAVTPQDYGARMAKSNRGRKALHIWQGLKEGKMGPYKKYAKNAGFQPLEYISEINPQAVREAHGRRMAVGKISGFIRPSQKNAYIRAQSDRVGVIGGGVFWDAAKQLNPKARPEGLPRIKTKAQRRTKGSERNKTKIKDSATSIIAEIIGSHDFMDKIHDGEGIIMRGIRAGEVHMQKELMIRELTLEKQASEA